MNQHMREVEIDDWFRANLRQSPPHVWTDIERRRAVALWNEGRRPKQIAAVLRRSEAGVQRILRLEIGKVSARPDRDRSRLIELWHAGTPTKAMAAELGIEQWRVWSMVCTLRRQGVHMPARKGGRRAS